MKQQISQEQVIAQNIVKELCKPENIDLLIKIKQQGSGTVEDPFMYGFKQIPPMTFDEFVAFEDAFDSIREQLGISENFTPVYKRYDAYLERAMADNDNRPLSLTQTERFEAIIHPFDDGWSGSFYGYLMRRVQFIIKTMQLN